MGRPTELLGVAELNELLEGRSLEVNSEVASFDGMHNYAPELYLEAGHSALRHIRLAMLTAGLEQADSILDFASGAGRVLRTLMAAFPDATLIASDVWERRPSVLLGGARGRDRREQPRACAKSTWRVSST